MKIDSTIVFEHIESTDSRIVVEQGGARSGKTYNIILWLVVDALRNPDQVITICRKTLPALKASAFRDFVSVLETLDIYDPAALNKTEMQYKLNGCLFEFLSVDDQQKIRSRKRDKLYINEANELTYDDWINLSIRTTGRIIIDFNPSMLEHWIFSDVITRDDCSFFQTTYLDNPFLEPEIVREIERLRDLDDTNWRIYGLGQRAAHRGLIFTNWQQCSALPDPEQEEIKGVAYGLDFGFSNDPTALVRLVMTKRGLYIDEVIYQTGLLNSDIAALMRERNVSRSDMIIADSAEPKTIEELRRAGFRIRASVKGADSVRSGINTLKQQSIFVTENSVNVIKELRNYKWRALPQSSASEERFANEPVDAFNHALDAARYGIQHISRGTKVIK